MQTRSVVLFVVFTLGMTSVSTARRWTHASGAYHVEAEFITSRYGKIWLLRSSGGVFGVDPTELSEADQRHVEKAMRERKARKTPTTENEPGRVPYDAGHESVYLQNEQIDESSGLARSRREAGFFWTHNDSGSDARVYLIDDQGRDRGSFLVQDTLAYDFEDIFSYSEDGRHFLVLCDVGNNGRAAPIQMLHIVDEPEFDRQHGLVGEPTLDARTIYYSYEDDHRDCEAVGFDPTSKTILFVSKERETTCYVYALPMPEPNPNKAFSARKIATLHLSSVTGMDVSSDGRRAVLSTYGHAYEFQRDPDEGWTDTFSRKPRRIVLPERVQGESISYGADEKTLYLTSEKLPTPLIVVPVLARPASSK
ncbi:MAG: SHD1 domain-containing protein [Pirellulaceae bacterium]